MVELRRQTQEIWWHFSKEVLPQLLGGNYEDYYN